MCLINYFNGRVFYSHNQNLGITPTVLQPRGCIPLDCQLNSQYPMPELLQPRDSALATVARLTGVLARCYILLFFLNKLRQSRRAVDVVV